jgi:predicted kinase
VRTILFLVGIPASGKSTFAKEHVRKDPTYKRVNKDELRFMVHDEDFKGFDRKKEDFIVKVRDDLIVRALDEGYNVLVDDTNIAGKHLARVQEIAEKWGREHNEPVTIEEKLFDTPLEECLRRNKARTGPRRVPDKVIKDMHRQLNQDKGVRPYRPFVVGLPECIVTDMDGTASFLNGRNPYDAKGCINDLSNEPVVGLLHDLMHRYAIVVVTGREDKDREETEQWLRNHGLRFAGAHDGREDGARVTGIVAVHMRKTGDKRKDSIIKREIYEAHILPHFNVKFVLDDRNQVVDAIRDMGIAVFQVAPGDF